jgi:hypothetical protein
MTDENWCRDNPEEAVLHIEELEQQLAEREKQIVMLREALKEIVDDYEDRFDMTSPSINPGIKFVIKQGTEALSAIQDLKELGK